MAETIVLAETTYGFDSGQLVISPAPFVLIEGETYRIVWDGVEHECVCSVLDGAPSLSDTDDPYNPTSGTFWIGYLPPDEEEGIADHVLIGAYDFSSGSPAFDTSTSHTIAIYLAAEEETLDGIVLKDRDGNNVTHEGVIGVKLQTVDGGTQKFLPGEAQEKTVKLDFSAGDMEVVPDDGMLLTKVGISKPANLIPANIAEGVNIAGIVGALTAGSGGGRAAIAANGSFTATGTSITIEHGLGVVPDMVVVQISNVAPANGTPYFVVQLHSEFAAQYGLDKSLWGMYQFNNYITPTGSTSGIEEESSTIFVGLKICDATAESFTVNAGTYTPFSSANKYNWYACGGLMDH